MFFAYVKNVQMSPSRADTIEELGERIHLAPDHWETYEVPADWKEYNGVKLIPLTQEQKDAALEAWRKKVDWYNWRHDLIETCVGLFYKRWDLERWTQTMRYWQIEDKDGAYAKLGRIIDLERELLPLLTQEEARDYRRRAHYTCG